jgi:hypothetical protein
MVDRRKFMLTAGTVAITPTAFGIFLKPVIAVMASEARVRLRIGLAGEWDRYVGGAFYDRISVPSSQRPMGFYHLRRGFLLPRLSSHQRVFLHFDAITYYGEVSVNGERLGAMGPYVP